MGDTDKQPRAVERAKQEFFEKPIATTILVVGAVVVVASATWAARSVLVLYLLPTIYAAFTVRICWFITFKSRSKERALRIQVLQLFTLALLAVVAFNAKVVKTKQELVELMPQTEAVLKYEQEIGVYPNGYWGAMAVIMFLASVMPNFRSLIRGARGIEDDDHQPST